jgi:hypothetical protein
MRESTVLVARLQLQLHGRLAEEGIVYLFVRPNEFDELDVQHVILGLIERVFNITSQST